MESLVQSIPYIQVLQTAATLLSGSGDTPDRATAAVLQTFIHRRAKEYWEMFFWPEWCAIEQRQFRPDYNNATTYAAGDERYYGKADKYFLALTDVTGVPPTDADGNIETAYWAEARGSYEGAEEYDEDTSWSVGDQVRDPESGNYYQSLVNDNQGNPVSDTTKWGLLVPFLRNIAREQTDKTKLGEVRKVWTANRLINSDACEIEFEPFGEDIIVFGSLTKVWVEFRKRPYVWTGGNYSTTATYTAGKTIYFTDDEFYTALEATSAGESPLTHPDKWQLQPFPSVLEDAVAQAAFADGLRADGQQDKFLLEEANALKLLRRQFDKIERQQGQHRTFPVRNR